MLPPKDIFSDANFHFTPNHAEGGSVGEGCMGRSLAARHNQIYLVLPLNLVDLLRHESGLRLEDVLALPAVPDEDLEAAVNLGRMLLNVFLRHSCCSENKLECFNDRSGSIKVLQLFVPDKPFTA